MTVAESIIKWLEGFPLEDKLRRIDVDILRPGSIRYALVKEPIQNVKSYLSGKKEYTDHYTFIARLTSLNSDECKENTGFGEAMENCVKEKDSAGEYPDIEDAVVTEVKTTTPFGMKATNDKESIYQMTISIKYVKEK